MKFIFGVCFVAMAATSSLASSCPEFGGFYDGGSRERTVFVQSGCEEIVIFTLHDGGPIKTAFVNGAYNFFKMKDVLKGESLVLPYSGGLILKYDISKDPYSDEPGLMVSQYNYVTTQFNKVYFQKKIHVGK